MKRLWLAIAMAVAVALCGCDSEESSEASPYTDFFDTRVMPEALRGSWVPTSAEKSEYVWAGWNSEWAKTDVDATGYFDVETNTASMSVTLGGEQFLLSDTRGKGYWAGLGDNTMEYWYVEDSSRPNTYTGGHVTARLQADGTLSVSISMSDINVNPPSYTVKMTRRL